MRRCEFNVEFGGEVRRLRIALGISLVELAKLTGLTSNFVSSIEDGSGDLSLSTIWSLAEALGMDRRKFFEGPLGASLTIGEIERFWSEVPPELQDMVNKVLNAMTRKKLG